MDKQERLEETRRVAEQAAEWLCALEDANAERLAAFTDWVRESPAHAREFLFMSALDAELLGKIDPERRLHVERIVAEASANVVRIPASGVPQRMETTHTLRRTRLVVQWVAGLAAVVILAVVLVSLWTVDANRHQTAIGEQRSVTLADGSIIYLNSQSRVEVRLTDDARNVRLVAGEAMFKVAHEERRPFRVYAGASLIQALGTQFNVNRRPSGTMISVVDGKVRVTMTDGVPSLTTAGDARPQSPSALTAQLAAGDEARVSNDGKIERRERVDPAAIAVWRQHRLVFRDDSLEDIVAEFNRYNETTRIVIQGDAIRARRYTAVFDADDPMSLVKFLEGEGDLALDSRGDELVIHEP